MGVEIVVVEHGDVVGPERVEKEGVELLEAACRDGQRAGSGGGDLVELPLRQDAVGRVAGHDAVEVVAQI